MQDWVAPLMIMVTFIIIIGSLSTFEKSSKHKLRKKGLNELEETLPRSHKTKHKLNSVEANQNTPKF